MSNKGKIIKNISIISVLFLVFIAMFNITSNAASKKTTLTQKDIQDMVKSDEWYTFVPTEYIGKPVVDRNAIGAGEEKYGYCIDSAHAQGGNYRIVNIIDINNMVEKEGQAKVYGVQSKTFKQGQKYTISQHPNLKPYIMTAYLASIPKETDGSLWNNYTTIQEIFYNKFYVKKMKNVGLYPDFQATNNNKESEMLKYNRILKKASKYADNYIKSSSASGYLEDNMTDKQKEKVEFKVIGNKTYIGPYKIKINGDCKVERITVNGIGASNIVITNSMDGIENRTKKDVNKTPDNKFFYIVVDAKLDKIDSVVLKGDKSKTILKGRLMVLAGGDAQDWVFYKAEESETPTELSLFCPEKKIGDIEILKKDEFNASLNFKNVGFKLYNVNRGWVAEDNNGNIKYVKHFDNAKEYKTGENGKVTIKNVDAGKYKIFETSIPEELEQYYKIGTWNVPIFGTEEREKRTAVAVKNDKDGYVHEVQKGSKITVTRVNTRAYSSLKIKKIDTDDKNATLTGIKFRVYRVGPDAGWVTVNDKKEYTGLAPDSQYDTNKNIAELMVLGNETETITKLPVGTYQIYETDLGPYTDKYTLGEFSVDGGKTVHKGDRKGEVEVKYNKQGIVEFTAKNTKKPQDISISGYVWKENKSGKNIQGKNTTYDDKNDELMQGIIVELVDRTTNTVVKTTTTDANGAYRFDGLSSEKLGNYIVRFTYNGYTYQDIISSETEIVDTPNTSKAVEDNSRKELNNLFEELEGEGQKLSNGTELQYNKKADNRAELTEATIDKLPKVKAATPKDLLKNYYNKDKSVKVIENINLGLYEREMPNLTIQKDTYSADVSVNGYTYTYMYNRKLRTAESEANLNKVSMAVDFDKDYDLPVYESDVKYDAKDAGKGLEATVMYKIKLQNASTNLYTTVNGIREAFSRNYELLTDEVYVSDKNIFDGEAKKLQLASAEMTDKDRNSEYIYGELKFKEPIKLASSVDANSKNTKYIFVKLKIKDIKEEYRLATDEATESNLKNIVEISRYSVYSDGNYMNKYAGVDETSIPNNLVLATYTPKEDDNDRAPGLKVVDAGTRTLSGTVFEDNDADGITGAGQKRIGNGILDENETGRIQGVTVKLVDENGAEKTVYNGTDWVSSAINTDEQGNFKISGFIPGKYKVVYTWGDENGKYNVADYKATVYTASNDWFTNATRFSDALDNWETRKTIDSFELTGEGEKVTKMDSTTPDFIINVENDNYGQEGYTYTINNIDFGIIERPRQSLDIDKKVKSVLVTTEAGQTVADASIENGQLKVKTGESYISGGEELGYIWLQLDKSITQSMTAKIGYVITVANNSEIDYADKDYYNYGTAAKNAVQMTLSADAVYDYMKGESISSDETIWKTRTITEYNEKIATYAEQQTITERSFMSQSKSFTDENNNIVSTGNWQTENKETQLIYDEWLEKLDTIETATVRNAKLEDREIAEYVGTELTKPLKPGESASAEIQTSKLIANGDEIRFDNDAEITEIKFETNQLIGRKPNALTSKTYDRAGWVSITPATGEDRDYTWIVVTAVSAIAILGVGVIFIKKKILK